MWIDLEGLANLRDVGGMPTGDGGAITAGRLLRSDNLQALTPGDIDRLLGLGLTDVVDRRSEYEVEQEGPGPAQRRGARVEDRQADREHDGEDQPDDGRGPERHRTERDEELVGQVQVIGRLRQDDLG